MSAIVGIVGSMRKDGMTSALVKSALQGVAQAKDDHQESLERSSSTSWAT